MAVLFEFPYNSRQPIDWAEKAALSVLNDLSDRRGIKHELDAIDYDVREEIVITMAAIIRNCARDAS